MRVLVTGAGGMLGTALTWALSKSGWEVIALNREELDITRREAVQRALAHIRPRVVVNAAAYTDVDGCESQTAKAFRVNALGPFNLALACREVQGLLLHFSTDYVFDGRATTPYREDSKTVPLSVYGKSKLAGEQAIGRVWERHVIFRTSWLFGPGGRNFVDTTLQVLAENGEMRVVADQVGCPTYTLDLAEGVQKFIARWAAGERMAFGLYHLTNSGNCSWFGLARTVATMTGYLPQRVKPITSGELTRPALRPRFSILAGDRWVQRGFAPLRCYRQALAAYLPDHRLQHVKEGMAIGS